MMPWLLVPALSIVNRLRGSSLWGSLQLRVISALLVGASVYVLSDWMTGAAFGLGYLAWSFLPWGRWYGLHRLDRDRLRGDPPAVKEPSWFEEMVEAPCGDSDHACLALAFVLGLVPLALALSLLGHPFPAVLGLAALAAGMTGVYELAWRFVEWDRLPPRELGDPIPLAEFGVGALWGAFAAFYLTMT